mmetsp:Transcript_17436/g.43393  ORF Transcript_17436/g.43393 Transcript_17436/m.43393 type:complete len:153 (-) Transcript_17436:242-700(-)
MSSYYAVNVGAKTFFSEERTFLHWMHVVTLFAFLLSLGVHPAQHQGSSRPTVDTGDGDDLDFADEMELREDSDSRKAREIAASEAYARGFNIGICLLSLVFTLSLFWWHKNRIRALESGISSTGREFRGCKLFTHFLALFFGLLAASRAVVT